MDSGLLYCAYQNQDQGPETLADTSFDRFYKFSLMKNCCCTFLKNLRVTKLKPGTHIESALMHRVYRNQGQGPITHGIESLDRFYVAILPCPTVMYPVSMN